MYVLNPCRIYIFADLEIHAHASPQKTVWDGCMRMNAPADVDPATRTLESVTALESSLAGCTRWNQANRADGRFISVSKYQLILHLYNTEQKETHRNALK